MKSAFKSGKPFQDRVRDAAQIRHEHPDKTPVIVERAQNEKNLPMLDKSKFLVPAHVTLHEFTRVLRRRLELAPGQAWWESILSSLQRISAHFDFDNHHERHFS